MAFQEYLLLLVVLPVVMLFVCFLFPFQVSQSSLVTYQAKNL